MGFPTSAGSPDREPGRPHRTLAPGLRPGAVAAGFKLPATHTSARADGGAAVSRAMGDTTDRRTRLTLPARRS